MTTQVSIVREVEEWVPQVREGLVGARDRYILLASRVVEAARELHESGHNGVLYAREYDALTDALNALDSAIPKGES